MATGKYHDWVTEDGLTLLQGWARDGLTDEQLAHNMGIAQGTFYAWKKKYSDISDALKKGKEVVDIEVENALLRRALGYRYTETTKELINGKLVVTKEVTKEIAPDTTAQAIWLNNRRPDKYRRNAGKEQLDRERFEHEKQNEDKKNW